MKKKGGKGREKEEGQARCSNEIQLPATKWVAD